MFTRLTNETVSTVPGGPRKSIHASPPFGGCSWWPSAASDAATANVSRFSTSNGILRITPPWSGGSAAFAARALYWRSTSSPPKTFVWPSSSTSVVARTTYPARPTAWISALSSARVGARLGELHVVRDRARAGLDEAVDRGGVVGARPPLPARVEVGERLRVDVDDDHVVGRGLQAADREPGVEAVVLEPAHQVRGVGDEGEPGHRHPDGEEERDAKARAARGNGALAAADPACEAAERGRLHGAAVRVGASGGSGTPTRAR